MRKAVIVSPGSGERLGCPNDYDINCAPILRMNPLKEEFSPRCIVVGLDAAYSEHFRRDRHVPGQKVVLPTADVA